MRLAFFDVDGVLSVPIYKEKDEFVIGFIAETWKAYCMEHGEDTYQYCKPVLPVKRYAENLQAEEVVLFALTATQSDAETQAKRKFLSKHYPGLFEEVLTVASQNEKLETIKIISQRYGAQLTDCELVEDTLSTLLEVRQYGIKPTHISAVVCDL